MSMLSGRALRDLQMVCVTICGVMTVVTSSPARAHVAEGTALAAATAQGTTDSVSVARTASKPARKPDVPTTKPAARPEFKSLRFDEAWTSASRSPHWNDALKAMPLAPQLTLTLGGQLRWREEFAHAFNLTSTSDTYAQSRVLLDADLKAGDARRVHGRLYLEVRDAQSYDRQLPGGTRPTDADRADVQNLFADAAIGRPYVRVGRHLHQAAHDPARRIRLTRAPCRRRVRSHGNLNVNRNMKVIFGYAVVLPGAFLRETPGGAQQERWGFAGTTFTF